MFKQDIFDKLGLNKDEIVMLKESINKKIEEKAKILAREELMKSNEDTLQKRLEEYVNDFTQKALKESISKVEIEAKKAKLEAVEEGFKTTMLLAGVELDKDLKGLKESVIDDLEKAYEETQAKLDELERENFELYKRGLALELSEDLNELQKDKFLTLVDSIFQYEAYKDKQDKLLEDMEALKQNIINDDLTESKEDEDVIRETTQPLLESIDFNIKETKKVHIQDDIIDMLFN